MSYNKLMKKEVMQKVEIDFERTKCWHAKVMRVWLQPTQHKPKKDLAFGRWNRTKGLDQFKIEAVTKNFMKKVIVMMHLKVKKWLKTIKNQWNGTEKWRNREVSEHEVESGWTSQLLNQDEYGWQSRRQTFQCFVCEWIKEVRKSNLKQLSVEVNFTKLTDRKDDRWRSNWWSHSNPIWTTAKERSAWTTLVVELNCQSERTRSSPCAHLIETVVGWRVGPGIVVAPVPQSQAVRRRSDCPGPDDQCFAKWRLPSKSNWWSLKKDGRANFDQTKVTTNCDESKSENDHQCTTVISIDSDGWHVTRNVNECMKLIFIHFIRSIEATWFVDAFERSKKKVDARRRPPDKRAYDQWTDSNRSRSDLQVRKSLLPLERRGWQVPIKTNRDGATVDKTESGKSIWKNAEPTAPFEMVGCGDDNATGVEHSAHPNGRATCVRRADSATMRNREAMRSTESDNHSYEEQTQSFTLMQMQHDNRARRVCD